MNVNAKKLTNPIQVEDLQKFIEKGKKNDFSIIKKEHGVSIYVMKLEMFTKKLGIVAQFVVCSILIEADLMLIA